MNPSQIVEVAEAGDLLLGELARFLAHFAPHTVAYKVGGIFGHIAALGGNVLAVASASLPSAPTPVGAGPTDPSGVVQGG